MKTTRLPNRYPIMAAAKNGNNHVGNGSTLANQSAANDDNDTDGDDSEEEETAVDTGPDP